MTIEIIPAGSSAVVTDRHGNHEDNSDRYRNHDRFAEVTRDVKDSEVRVTRDVKDSSTTSVRDIKDARFDITQEVNKTGTASVLATKDSRYDVVDKLSGGFTAQALAACKIDDSIGESKFSALLAFKDAAATAYQMEGRSLLEAAKNSAALSVQADKNSAGLSVQSDKNSAFLSVQADKNSSAILVQSDKNTSELRFQMERASSAAVLLATQIAAQAAKDAAECCCELKSLITSDGNMTRALINANETQNLRDRAARAEGQLAAYFARNVAPVTP